MYVIENEIMSQHTALQKTCAYMRDQRAYVEDIFARGFSKIVFMGCGSSFMLARSAATIFSVRTGIKAAFLAGGDYIVNPQGYAALIKDALVVMITRSGETSEISYAVDTVKASGNNNILCLHANKGSTIPAKCAWELSVEWAYDESVCQTRNISNFFTALVWLYAIYARDNALMDDLDKAAAFNEAYKLETREALKKVGELDWANAIVLADGELCGIAQEGALAFNEICIKRGEYFNFLDYRHGPMVLCGKKTLVICVVRDTGRDYQLAMIKDLKAKGAYVVAISTQKEIPGADLTVTIAGGDYLSWGMNMIYVPQMIAYSRALVDGHNPDEPDGLDPYITI